MKKFASIFKIPGLLGKCGGLDVFMGFATTTVLCECSFADILNEDTGLGYQRPYNKRHSSDFKKYISRPRSSTPPLVFNLRSELADNWALKSEGDFATLELTIGQKSIAQVDCQHRLGEISEEEIPLAFMAFIGLNLKEEMAIFNVINSKAKGLSSSLTDYHESKLLSDLATEAPQLYISRKLNEDVSSPWYKMIRYGGETTSGLKRRTSFRMMQKAVHSFLQKVNRCDVLSPDEAYIVIVNFWMAVRGTFVHEWDDHRHHLLTKGIGLHSMMQMLSDFVIGSPGSVFTEEFFLKKLSPLKGRFDWSSKGPFSAVSGRKGVVEVYKALREKVSV